MIKSNKVRWDVNLNDDGYVRVVHSERGVICAGRIDRDGRITDIAFLNEDDRKCNMIRMPAMTALAKWERSR